MSPQAVIKVGKALSDPQAHPNPPCPLATSLNATSPRFWNTSRDGVMLMICLWGLEVGEWKFLAAWLCSLHLITASPWAPFSY